SPSARSRSRWARARPRPARSRPARPSGRGRTSRSPPRRASVSCSLSGEGAEQCGCGTLTARAAALPRSAARCRRGDSRRPTGSRSVATGGSIDLVLRKAYVNVVAAQVRRDILTDRRRQREIDPLAGIVDACSELADVANTDPLLQVQSDQEVLHIDAGGISEVVRRARSAVDFHPVHVDLDGIDVCVAEAKLAHRRDPLDEALLHVRSGSDIHGPGRGIVVDHVQSACRRQGGLRGDHTVALLDRVNAREDELHVVCHRRTIKNEGASAYTADAAAYEPPDRQRGAILCAGVQLDSRLARSSAREERTDRLRHASGPWGALVNRSRRHAGSRRVGLQGSRHGTRRKGGPCGCRRCGSRPKSGWTRACRLRRPPHDTGGCPALDAATGALADGAARAVRSRGSQTAKRAPQPRPSLAASITPPCSSTRSRAIERPRPRPPWRRVVPPSACRKRSKTCGRNPGSIPSPVSVTVSTTSVSPTDSCASTMPP